MKLDDALNILSLETPFTYKQLKRSYHSKALIYHPDKYIDTSNNDYNKSIANSKFRDIYDSYQYLQHFTDMSYSECINNEIHISRNKKLNNNNDMKNKNVYQMFNKGFFMDYIKYVLTIDENTIELIQSILSNTSKITSALLNRLNKHQLCQIEKYLRTYKHSCKSLYSIIYALAYEWKDNKKIYTIRPTIDDLLSNNIYVFNYSDDVYYIPLWLHHLEYNDFIVIILPDLPKHIDIDTDNHIHFYLSLNKDNQTNNIPIHIGKKVFYISSSRNTTNLDSETITFHHEGIFQISNTDNIFDVSNNKKSNIYIHIQINEIKQ